MRFRKLRIAFSVTCGIVAVLLIGSWARGYSHNCAIWLNQILIAESKRGVFSIVGIESSFIKPGQSILDGSPLTEYDIEWDNWTRATYQNRLGFGFQASNYHSRPQVFMPAWFAVVVLLCGAIAPWARQIRYRFSLHTLLVAMTLIAVVLGLIVWLR